VLDKSKTEVKEARWAQKFPLAESDVLALLKSVATVIIAKGRNSVTLKAADAKPDDLKGPTGNFRAPMVRRGRTLLVGFNAEALKNLL
jgi:hypothetical protein